MNDRNLKLTNNDTSHLTNCSDCKNTECIHRQAYRRLPTSVGGLGLCPNLQKLK